MYIYIYVCFNIGLKHLRNNCLGGYPPKQGEPNYALRLILHLGLRGAFCWSEVWLYCDWTWECMAALEAPQQQKGRRFRMFSAGCDARFGDPRTKRTRWAVTTLVFIGILNMPVRILSSNQSRISWNVKVKVCVEVAPNGVFSVCWCRTQIGWCIELSRYRSIDVSQIQPMLVEVDIDILNGEAIHGARNETCCP